jgi:hypothetical protein
MRALSVGYRIMTFGWRLALAAGVAAAPLPAQVVRGVIRESTSGAPVPGVVVSLDTAAAGLDPGGSLRRASLVLATLTNEKGEYAVRANTSGRFVLSAKRVGLRRYQSAPFQLNVGETRRLDFALEAIDVTTTLAAVSVTTDAPCAIHQAEGRQVAALWEEASAALAATRLSLRDRLFRATTVRYVRELHPSALRVLREDRVIRHGVTEQPFRSIAADQLSAHGYSRPEDGAIVFYAPDAAVLMSPEFLRDHCFSVVRSARDRAGQVGLAFEPVRVRERADIRGALWIDSTSFELRSVDFRYTNLVNLPAGAQASGEVQFRHLPNGAWHVSQWYIRIPAYRAAAPTLSVPLGARPTLSHYREEGGDVTPDGQTTVRGAILHGRALDSSGRAPLRGATVRLAGTAYTASVQADGSFRLDSLPGGSYTLAVDHPLYGALGMLATEQELDITANSTSQTVLQALSTSQILRRLCGTDTLDRHHAVARVILLEADESPVRDARVEAGFERYDIANRTSGAILSQQLQHAATTDDRGAAVFCALPALQPVRLVARGAGSDVPIARREVKLERQSISVVTIRRSPP